MQAIRGLRFLALYLCGDNGSVQLSVRGKIGIAQVETTECSIFQKSIYVIAGQIVRSLNSLLTVK